MGIRPAPRDRPRPAGRVKRRLLAHGQPAADARHESVDHAGLERIRHFALVDHPSVPHVNGQFFVGLPAIEEGPVGVALAAVEGHHVEVAREVFRERGYDASLDDIAKRAGVGPGTLYRHFPTRDALLDGNRVQPVQEQQVVDELVARDLAHVVAARDPAQALAVHLEQRLDQLADLPERDVDVAVAKLPGDVGEAGAQQERKHPVAVRGDRGHEMEGEAGGALPRARELAQHDQRRRAHVAPGAFVAAVGADHPEKSEIAPDLMARDSRNRRARAGGASAPAALRARAARDPRRVQIRCPPPRERRRTARDA